MRTDMFGRKISKRKIKKDVISENRARGKAGEEAVKFNYSMRGYEMERSPRGKDFIARKRDAFGRVIETKHVEVKTGKAKLSPLQQKTKKSKRNYKVERVELLMY